MTETEQHSSPSAPSPTRIAPDAAKTVPDTAHLSAAIAPEPLVKAKPKRTFGLKTVDVVIYPLLTNVGVFALSVWTSYVTNFRTPVDPNPSDPLLKRTYDIVCRSLHGRAKNWFAPVERMLGVPEGSKAAGNIKMVFFSFVDGTLLAPLIKLLEDQRNNLAKKIDTVFGTKPADESVYNIEPHQTWKSILLGRAKTALIVASTALVLQNVSVAKVEGGIAITQGNDANNLNKSFLGNFGEFVEKNVMKRFAPKVNEAFGDKSGKFSYTLAFEAFYTSVCTGCLYIFSRAFARKGEEKKHVKEVLAERHAAEAASAAAPVAVTPSVEHSASLRPTPAAIVTTPIHVAPKTAETHDATVQKSMNTLISKLSAKTQPHDWQHRVQEAPEALAGLAKA